MAVPLPVPLSVRNMLEDLLGREVTVNPGTPILAEDLPLTTIAVYVDRSLQLAGVLGLDLPLAANAGAALGLLPPGSAEDSVEDKELSPMLAENVGELCNVFTSLLNKDGQAHLKLYQVYSIGDSVPADIQSQLLAFGQRLDLSVEVSRYGTGRLCLSLTN